jgi:hypothetical protein
LNYDGACGDFDPPRRKQDVPHYLPLVERYQRKGGLAMFPEQIHQIGLRRAFKGGNFHLAYSGDIFGLFFTDDHVCFTFKDVVWQI